MITIKHLSIVCIVASSLSLHGMGYVKSFFVTPECFKDPARSAERTKTYEALKASTQKQSLSWGQVTSVIHRSDGKDTCVLEKLGQEEKPNLYAQITNLITSSKNKDFFDPKNLSASNQALHNAQNALSIIRLGSYAETDTPEYKFAEKGLADIEKNLKMVPEEKKPAQTKASS